jgi:hypothetical protein
MMAMKGFWRRKNRTAVHRKVRIMNRAEWIGFFWVIMRSAARIATEDVPRKINHWKMMLKLCVNMDNPLKKSPSPPIQGNVT